MNDQAIIAVVGISSAAACAMVEVLRPARPILYRDVFPRDLVVFLFYLAVIVPIAARAAGPLFSHLHLPSGIHRWPLAARLLAYYLVADLGSYWLHRLMHTRHVWRVHKWHHSPKYMYWMTSVRASAFQQFLFTLPAVVGLPLIEGLPPLIFLGLSLEGIVRNDWMHMNVSWRSNWLEWIFVTPRYHHIHHSDDPAHHHSNYGSLFSIWDRLFGTRVDPDSIIKPLTFGTGEEDSAIRLVLGL